MRDPSLSDWQPAPVQNHREFQDLFRRHSFALRCLENAPACGADRLCTAIFHPRNSAEDPEIRARYEKPWLWRIVHIRFSIPCGMQLTAAVAARRGLFLNLPPNLQDQGVQVAFGHYGLLPLLRETAMAYPTTFLNVTPELFWSNPSFRNYDEFEELAETITTPDDGGPPYLTYPMVESFQHDLCRSSADAISLWLGDEIPLVGVRVGRLPICLPPAPNVQDRESGHSVAEITTVPDVTKIGSPVGQATLTEEKTTPTTVPSEIPAWDFTKRELRFRNELVRCYGTEPAERQIQLLSAFQQNGWSESIENPLMGGDVQLYQTVYCLNCSFAKPLIHFAVRGGRVFRGVGPRPSR